MPMGMMRKFRISANSGPTVRFGFRNAYPAEFLVFCTFFKYVFLHSLGRYCSMVVGIVHPADVLICML